MKKIIAAVLLVVMASPAFADGTINTLSVAGALGGSESIPIFQTANPAVRTTPTALSTFLASTSQVLTNKTVNCANNTCTVRIGTDVSGMGSGVATALAAAVNASGGVCTVGGAGCLSSLTVTGAGNTSTGVTTLALQAGLSVPSGSSGTANVSEIVTWVTDAGASRTLASGDGNTSVNMTNGSATTITMPDSATVGNTWGMTLICDAGCTVNRAGADTINGGTSFVVPAKGWAVLENAAAGAFKLGLLQGVATFPLASLSGAGTGVLTAAAANLSASGGLTTTIASGAKALATGAISSAACTTAQTDTATNTVTTDVVLASFNGDPTGVTGYIPLTAGMLTIIAYPTSGTVNFKVCNNTSGSITPGAITLNWRVVR